MIYSLTGKLTVAKPNMVVIECGGVGYFCLTSMTTLSKLPALNAQASIFTYMNVREGAVDLFGFADLSELECFKMMLTVSGVGPKAALAILSELTPEKFALAVASNDAKSLTRAQGVGPKLAQRIVLELKDKVSSADITGTAFELPSSEVFTDSSNIAQAVSALVVLGYSQSEAAQAVSKLAPETPVEEMIKAALKQMMRA